ncbi:MAG: hemerythrin family protein [Candidatus Thiodiazotropha taylori]|nr:hemerythrin family protein [Candidatus Thiodiazotropha taylori]
MTKRGQILTWNKNYEFGIDAIDFQHHYFLELINRIAENLLEPGNIKFQGRLIEELNAYARFHFISEENIMMLNDYPEIESHRAHHHELLEALSVRGTKLAIEPSEEESRQIIYFLSDWFMKHTLHEDKLYADYISRKNS